MSSDASLVRTGSSTLVGRPDLDSRLIRAGKAMLDRPRRHTGPLRAPFYFTSSSIYVPLDAGSSQAPNALLLGRFTKQGDLVGVVELALVRHGTSAEDQRVATPEVWISDDYIFVIDRAIESPHRDAGSMYHLFSITGERLAVWSDRLLSAEAPERDPVAVPRIAFLTPRLLGGKNLYAIAPDVRGNSEQGSRQVYDHHITRWHIPAILKLIQPLNAGLPAPRLGPVDRILALQHTRCKFPYPSTVKGSHHLAQSAWTRIHSHEGGLLFARQDERCTWQYVDGQQNHRVTEFYPSVVGIRFTDRWLISGNKMVAVGAAFEDGLEYVATFGMMDRWSGQGQIFAPAHQPGFPASYRDHPRTEIHGLTDRTIWLSFGGEVLYTYDLDVGELVPVTFELPAT